MDSQKNKKIMLAIIAVCLIAAAVVVFSRPGGESSGPPGGVGYLAYKCTQCGHGQMIHREAAMKMAQQQGGAPGFGPPALNCPACNAAKSFVSAKQCTSCKEIFFIGQAKDPQSPLKCPTCGKTPEPMVVE